MIHGTIPGDAIVKEVAIGFNGGPKCDRPPYEVVLRFHEGGECAFETTKEVAEWFAKARRIMEAAK